MNYLSIVLSLVGFDVSIDSLAMIENRKADTFNFSIVNLNCSFCSYQI